MKVSQDGPGLRRGEAEDEAIGGREIGRPLPAAY
jgi:hypothetical protein